MERIGEYELLRLIGEGGMGKVFEAEERLSKRRVAVKLLRPELAQSDAARELFRNEMAILAKLDHPNLVRMFACAEIDGRMLMALELLEGQTLREALSNGALPWTRAVSVAFQIAAGLAVAHSPTHAIVHRDLKPENVMLVGDSGVKVMDFGVAKVLQALRKNTTHSVGTLQYMSPEQIDAREIDARTDLYCLGLVFYEMLSGRPPFESASPRELLNLQCTAEPKPLPDEVRRGLPRGIEQLLFRLLEKKKELRPGSADEVCRALEPFVPSLGARAEQTLERTKVESADSVQTLTSASASGTAATMPLEAALHRTEPPASAKDSKRKQPSSHVSAHDTIALVERATAPRQVSRRTAALIVCASVFLASIVTYVVRLESRARQTPEPVQTAFENAP